MGRTNETKTPQRQVHHTVTKWNDTIPEDGVTFYYAVTTVNPVGESTRSDIINLMYGILPDPPTDLRVEEGSGTVILNWSAPIFTGGVPILGYHIYRGKTRDELEYNQTVLGQLSFVDVGLENGVRYFYRISSFNSIDNSSLSNLVSAMPKGPPLAPRDLEVVVGDGKLTLRWRQPASSGGSAIVGYRILRGTDPGSLELMTQLGWSEISYIDDQVVNGVAYYYAVLAYSALGEGLLSNIIDRTPSGLPSTPMNLTALVGIGQVDLSWDSPEVDGGTPISVYVLFKGPSGTDLTRVRNIPGDETSYIDTDLDYGSTVFYAVTAVSGGGDGPRTKAIGVWPVTLPGPPENAWADAALGSVTVQWNPPTETGGSNVTGYIILRGLSSDDMSSMVTVD
ncbi:MAG: fibronectin type III domain-containing protein, partial [Thermoplasmata archaeon]|nr:fibronectin type III domain-containing protein [Thermoplasmata archaeon]